MSLVAFSIKLERIDEGLLYRDPGGGWWLGGVCTLDTDSKGRMVVAQSISKEKYAAGERGPALGTWREIGKPKTDQSGKPGFDLAKFKKAPVLGQVSKVAEEASRDIEQAEKADRSAFTPEIKDLFPAQQAVKDERSTTTEPHSSDEAGF